MVGFVIVSHSKKLAEGVIDLVRMTSKKVKIEAAGGMDDGTYGTSFDKINEAINKVMDNDGVIVLCDMGSAVMTTEMVIENFPNDKVLLANCSLVEGAVTGAIEAECDLPIDKIMEDLKALKNQEKF